MSADPDAHLEAHHHVAPMQHRPSGPLVGLRILDLTHALAGPFGSMVLADLGAEVIKVEPPSGELVRFNGPFTRDDEGRHYGSRFGARNRNKRCIALDLNDAEDREVFFQLVETADGLIENQRAGVLDRLGVSYEACRARNPQFVYAAVRGFGDRAPEPARMRPGRPSIRSPRPWVASSPPPAPTRTTSCAAVRPSATRCPV
ncbi:MAG: CoA transferase [Acidimicrobiales bacterium]